jgi:hypothetical protein
VKFEEEGLCEKETS